MPAIKLARCEDARTFHDVMQAAYDSLDNKDLYICDDYEYVRAVLENPDAGFGLMYYQEKSDEKLDRNSKEKSGREPDSKYCAGVLLVTFPGEAEDNLARDIFSGKSHFEENTFPAKSGNIPVAGKLPGENDLTENMLLKGYLMAVAHIESAAVRAEYRGNGIQKKLIEYACDYLCRKCGNIRYAMATVSPDNIPSLKSFEKAGFKIMLTKEKYGGKLRHILKREIHGGGLYG